HRTRL
ncbi:beta-lactamase family protein, partial [Vibrio parahaemolyticus V-223/04]